VNDELENICKEAVVAQL